VSLARRGDLAGSRCQGGPPSRVVSSRRAASREETVKKHGQDLVLGEFSTRVDRANGRTNLSTQGNRR
jgi:hypothetical protein